MQKCNWSQLGSESVTWLVSTLGVAPFCFFLNFGHFMLDFKKYDILAFYVGSYSPGRKEYLLVMNNVDTVFLLEMHRWQIWDPKTKYLLVINNVDTMFPFYLEWDPSHLLSNSDITQRWNKVSTCNWDASMTDMRPWFSAQYYILKIKQNICL